MLMPNGKRKIADGPKTIFRCYAASDEVQYKAVFEKRQKNFELILAARHPTAHDGFDLRPVQVQHRACAVASVR